MVRLEDLNNDSGAVFLEAMSKLIGRILQLHQIKMIPAEYYQMLLAGWSVGEVYPLLLVGKLEKQLVPVCARVRIGCLLEADDKYLPNHVGCL